MVAFYQFQPTLATMFQQGFIAREIEEGLDSELAFRAHATEETIGGRLGQIVILQKMGRKAPVTQPLNPNSLTANLDNGMTPSLAGVEQYQLVMSEWGDTEDVDLIGSEASSADLVMMAARNNGVQAAQSLERLAKIQYRSAYEGGNTWIRGDLGSNNTTTVHVDDVTGFTQVPVNGVLTNVSTMNPLTVYEQASQIGGVTQVFQVTGVALDNPNNSTVPGSSLDAFGNVISDGQSGVLTITGATVTPVAGDALIAQGAAKVIRPMNKPSFNILTSGDAATLGLLLDGVARLRANNVPTFADGTYHFIHDPAVQRQLFADNQFQVAYAARYNSKEFQSAQIFELLGITFIPTTECYVQPPNPALGIKTVIRRSLLCGAGSLIQGNFDGIETYANQDGLDPLSMSEIVNGIAHIIRPPLDRLGRIVTMTWTWIGSFTCPTDMLTVPIIVPTASNSIYKRALWIQTGG